MTSHSQLICLYGAGELGQLAIDFCELCGIEVAALVDRSDKSLILYSMNGTKYTSIMIHEYLENYSNLPLYICIATLPYNLIKQSLINQGVLCVHPFYSLTSDQSSFPLNNGWFIDSNYLTLDADIARVVSFLADEHSISNYKSFILWHKSFDEVCDPHYPFDPGARYLLPELLEFLQNRSLSVIDVGAHFGQCVSKLQNVGIHFEEHHFFEPDLSNYKQLISAFKDVKNCHFYPVALYSDSIETYFYSGYNYCSSLSPYGNISLMTRLLDSYELNCDFLKIHTEGSELDILKGSIATILRHKPAIALSVYHNDNGICKIFDWFHSNLPFYKLYFRCHNFQGTGAFLYCIPSTSSFAKD